MNITRLRLVNFKRHTELERELSPGLNIVRGPNESGKTSVQQAIEMGLFRRATSAAQELEDARSWRDPAADPIIEIEFDDDAGRGTLRKTFAGSRGTVELRLGEETHTDPAAVEQLVAEMTGLSSEKFFRATASVHHQQLDGLDQDENTLRDRLQESMSGADRGTQTARRKLEEAIRRHRTEGPKNPGYLKVLREKVEQLHAQVSRGEAALADLETDRRTLGEAVTHRAELDRRLAEQRDGVATAERAMMLNATIAGATQSYNRYRKASDLRDEIDKLAASQPSPVPLTTLKSTIAQLRDQEFTLSEMRAELAAEPDLSGFDVAIAMPRWRPWAALTLLLGVGAVGAVAGGAVTDNVALGGVAALILGLLAVGALWRTVGMRRRVADVRMQNELREAEIARRLAGRKDLAERVTRAERERASALASVGASDIAAAEAVLAAQVEHEAALATSSAEYKGVLGDEEPLDDVRVLRDRAAAEADTCRHTLAGMGEIGTDPERHLATFKLAVARLTPEREAALQAESRAEARLATNDVDAESVAADAEALSIAVAQLAAAERRLRIYEDVLATLDTAVQTTMKKAARYLEERMSGDIERITDGRYRRLRVDETKLSFTVYSVEKNDWIDVHDLSHGTLDQFYLCARLGIVRQIAQGASPPLIFDDPFITFDDERARRALAVLKDISREHQVIYLTTSDRYDSVADAVVELSAPAERDELDDAELELEREPVALADFPVEAGRTTPAVALTEER